MKHKSRKSEEVYVTCHDIHGNTKDIPASQLYFRPSVYGVLIENEKILLLKQWEGYDFPGGGMEKHETIIDCLKREFWEETGLDVEPVGLVACETSFFIMPHERGFANCQVIYYAVRKVGGYISTDNFDEHEKEYASEAEWVPLSEIKKIRFYNSVDSIKIIKLASTNEASLT